MNVSVFEDKQSLWTEISSSRSSDMMEVQSPHSRINTLSDCSTRVPPREATLSEGVSQEDPKPVEGSPAL